MSSVFDRLQKQLEVQKREQGISALDIADLPPNLRKIMRLMLRNVAMKYSEICSAVQALPQSQQLTQPELDQALDMLVEQNWLVRAGEGEMLTYRVNLRRKAGSSLDKDIWASLDTKIVPTKPKNVEEPSPPDEG